jgi:hypothetical protein
MSGIFEHCSLMTVQFASQVQDQDVCCHDGFPSVLLEELLFSCVHFARSGVPARIRL